MDSRFRKQGHGLKLPSLRIFRFSRGYAKQSDLAMAVGVSVGVIQRIEAGGGASYDTCQKLAKTLKTDIEALARPVAENKNAL